MFKLFVKYGVKMQNLRCFSNQPFRFTDYDCLGFDLDCTLCKYRLGALVKLEYELVSSLLTKSKGYPDECLNKPLEEHADFLLKGVILDQARGNIIKLDGNGHVDHATHGCKLLKDIKDYTSCKDVKEFVRNPLHQKKFVPILDYFGMPASLIFTRTVEGIDRKNRGKPLSSYKHVLQDIRSAYDEIFSRENLLSRTGFFKELSENPSRYYHKSSDKLLDWLRKLRSRNKVLFLITGSSKQYVDITTKYCLQKGWRDIFNIAIFTANKPYFFFKDYPFLMCDNTSQPVNGSTLKEGNCYDAGNWRGLYNFLKKVTGNPKPKALFIGDHLIQDIYAPASRTECSTVVVSEEMQAENLVESDHEDKHILTSSTWGSFFECKKKSPTFWCRVIQKHSKLCIPSLEYVVKFPVDHAFHSIFPVGVG